MENIYKIFKVWQLRKKWKNISDPQIISIIDVNSFRWGKLYERKPSDCYTGVGLAALIMNNLTN